MIRDKVIANGERKVRGVVNDKERRQRETD